MRFKQPDQITFSTAAGEIKPEKLQVSAGPPSMFNWRETAMPTVSMACGAQGKAIEQWIIRNSTSMQNCVWPGKEPVALSEENFIHLSATLVLH